MRPCLALDEDDLARLEAIQVSAHHAAEIQWGVGDAQPRDGGVAGHLVAGGGAGGEHKAAVRLSGAPGVDEFEREHRLAHAHSVHVHRGPGIIAVLLIDGGTFQQASAQTTAAQHFHDPAG